MLQLLIQRKTRNSGFTLTELMIVVAILSITSAILAPVIINSLPTMRIRDAARDIYSAMMQAKTEAIRRGENVTILFNSPGDSYIVFLDNGAGAGGLANDEVRNGAEPILVTTTLLPDRVNFNPNLIVSGVSFVDGVSFVNNAAVFSPRGIPIGAGGGLGGGRVGLLATTGSWRNIIISTAGRISIQNQ